MVKISVTGLKAYYLTEKGPVQAVDSVNLNLLDNESLGIVGESACGKSTLGSALMHSMQPPGKIIEGEIQIDDLDLSSMPKSEFDKQVRWKKVAMIFQGAMNALDPVYSVGSQMREVLKEHGYPKDAIEDKITESLKQMGLDESVARRYPHELSGGMKQRVVIAMALLLEPALVIADEPTTALDVLVQSHIVDLLMRLRKEKGITIIMITHDLALVSKVVDKIAIMYAGQIVEVGTTCQIFKDPKHPYTKALIQAIPKLHSNDKIIHYIPGSPPSLLNPESGCRYYQRCPHAMDVCKKDPPEFLTDTGYVKCWLYEENGKIRQVTPG